RTVTAIPGGATVINTSGNDGMATAGSGDLLTGIIASLAAQGEKMSEAAWRGVYLHGLAGDSAKEKFGAHSMTSSDIIDVIYTLKE
ncbi:MAG: bifunctional ADP-dependent NAD(P)H-hydrate dehydratase/NAD(P)H-hydrate epimerase, partial [Lachnospiraceae bacterium]|nr:bifunctional ADP-dependent NAD(P)H-hydrate dehydratase/NAD(P)H-hydrate epimerase [Lachnospiraceae bacterium]